MQVYMYVCLFQYFQHNHRVWQKARKASKVARCRQTDRRYNKKLSLKGTLTMCDSVKFQCWCARFCPRQAIHMHNNGNTCKHVKTHSYKAVRHEFLETVANRLGGPLYVIPSHHRPFSSQQLQEYKFHCVRVRA